MILDNSLEAHGYARIILCDYHKEYPIPHPKLRGHTVVDLIYNADEVQEVQTFLGMPKPDELEPFDGLDIRYNGYYGPGMSIWLIQGSLENLIAIFYDFARTLKEGPIGGDDDSYDYWPNAMEMLLTFAMDLEELTDDKGPWADELVTIMHRTIHNREDDPEWSHLWDSINAFANREQE